MKKSLFVATTFLSLTLIANGQQAHRLVSILSNKKAVNAFGDVSKLLAKNVNFPVDQLGPNVAGSEGDVTLSLVEVKVMGISTTKKVMMGTTTTTTRRVY